MIRSIFLCFFTYTFCLFIPLIANDNIRIETFRGCEIRPYIQQIVKLCDRIYRESPYLYNGDDDEYTSYVESYSQSNDAIICLAFAGEDAVGLAIGIPMSKTRDLYKQTLVEHGYELNNLFYLGEFGLHPNYRNHGIEKAMYLEIENFVKEDSSFNMICLWEVENMNPAPSEDTPQDKFWKELGFIRHADIHFQIFWTNIGDIIESAHLAIYSFKQL